MKNRFWITILVSIFTFCDSVSAQDTKSVERETIAFMYDSFVLDDRICHQVIKNDIMVTVSVELVRQFGRFIRVKMEVANLSENRITFYPQQVKAKIMYDGVAYDLDIYGYDRYMNRVKRRSTMLSVLRDLGSQVGYEVYSVKDYSEWLYGKYRTSSVRPLSVDNQIVFGRNFNQSNQPLTYNKGGVSSFNIDAAYAGGDYYRYRTEITRHYLRANSLSSGRATGGYLMVKRRPGDTFYLELDVVGENFKFEWSLKEEQQNNRKSKNSTFFGW